MFIDASFTAQAIHGQALYVPAMHFQELSAHECTSKTRRILLAPGVWLRTIRTSTPSRPVRRLDTVCGGMHRMDKLEQEAKWITEQTGVKTIAARDGMVLNSELEGKGLEKFIK